MEDNFFSKIKEFKNVAPSAEWKASQKEVLMTQVRAQVKNRKSGNAYGAVFMQAIKNVFELRSFSLLFKRSSIAFLSAVLVLGTGVFGVQAAEKSLPGDFLYSVKRTKEKMRVSLSSSEERRAELHIEFAGKRLQEFAVLKEQELDSDKKVEKMTVAVIDFKEEINEVKEKLSKAEYTIKEPAKIIEVAGLVDEKIEEFTDYLDENIKTDASNDLTVRNHLGILDTVEDAIKTGKEVSVEAVTLLVKQKDKEGVQDEVKEEIKQTVIRKIKKAQEDVEELADEIIDDITTEEILDDLTGEGKEADVEEFTEENEVLESAEEETQAEEGEGLEKEVSPEEENVIESEEVSEEEQPQDNNEEKPESNLDELPETIVVEVKKVIEEEPKKAENLLTEAGQLADEGDLGQALEKLQATQSLVDETKDKVDDIITKAIEEVQNEVVKEEDSQQPEKEEVVEDSSTLESESTDDQEVQKKETTEVEKNTKEAI